MTKMNQQKRAARAKQAETGWNYTKALAWVRDAQRPDARCEACGKVRRDHEAETHPVDYQGQHAPAGLA